MLPDARRRWRRGFVDLNRDVFSNVSKRFCRSWVSLDFISPGAKEKLFSMQRTSPIRVTLIENVWYTSALKSLFTVLKRISSWFVHDVLKALMKK